MGHLLVLRDVTERRHAQAQILEQQRSLAMLREREQLARELHDGIGQVLGYASLQWSGAGLHRGRAGGAGCRGRPQAGARLGEARNQLARLSSVVEERARRRARAHPQPARWRPPSSSRSSRPCSITWTASARTTASRPSCRSAPGWTSSTAGSDGADCSSSASSRRRFPTRASTPGQTCVQVTFEGQDGLLHVRIQDDGDGFDPARAARRWRSHFGLRFMRERAEQIGGSLAVESAPGAGTCVRWTCPCKASGSRRSSDENPDRR